MIHRLKKIGTAAAVVLGLLVLSATPADAYPVPDDHVYEHEVGPDKRDWFCTFQLSVNAITCAWAPGEGSTAGTMPLVRRPYQWWNVFTW